MKAYTETLTANGVSIQSDEYGTRAYINSARGRAQLEAECPAEIVQQVYAVWGGKPIVEELVLPTQPAPQPTAEQQQLAAMALHQAQTDTTITELRQANEALMLQVAGGKA